MGEARRRGTFEQRKARAVEAGRLKHKRLVIRHGRPENGFKGMPHDLLIAILSKRSNR